MLVDLPLDRLREYRPEPEEPADAEIARWLKGHNGHEGGAEYDLPGKLSALASAFGRGV